MVSRDVAIGPDGVLSVQFVGDTTSNLAILLGNNDDDGEDDSLRRDDGSDEQGRNRLERGMYFYRTSRDVAARESLPFQWRLTILPGIAHSHTDMAAAAAPMLLGDHP